MANNVTQATVEVNVVGKIDQFSKSINQIQGQLSKLDLNSNMKNSFNGLFSNITKNLDQIRDYTANNKLQIIDSKEVSKLFNNITSDYNKLLNKLNGLGIDTASLKSANDLIAKMSALEKDYADKIDKSNNEVNKATRNLENQKKALEQIKNNETTINALNKHKGKTIEEVSKEYEKQKKITDQIRVKAQEALKAEQSQGNYQTSNIENKNNAFANRNQIGKDYLESKEATEQLKQEVEALKLLEEAEKTTAEAEKSQQAALKSSSQIYTDLQSKITPLANELKQFGIDSSSIKSIDDLRNAMATASEKGASELVTTLQNVISTAEQSKPAFRETEKSIKDAEKAVVDFTNHQNEIDNFKRRLTQFFSIDNSVRLFRRALRSSFNTIKELDAAMTEMAVVTKLDISDYWDQLPKYTEAANKLGLATKAVYEASTLYYQQGLKTQQVEELTTATLKMARIAGLDAAEATDRMTNALRGFNMELNQTNADKVADVYSKLAAITASNVNEISTAMTKTASIASSAGMQFETTAAFLSQIIETTRESAETAGTALKTVIARFEELKKSPDEIGEVDGEIVDANKVESALRSVGIALRDSEGQFRNLDEVFIELAQKWDSLDKNTQRYIATIAAGSRQQSRFIAMMSDYDRTMQLVEAANNSGGASTEQFNKTLDSLASKIDKLKNAWNEFTMGLANQGVVKGGINILTNLLNLINKLTKGWDNTSSSVLKFGVALGSIKAGRKILDTVFNTFRKSSAPLQDLSKIATSSFKNLFVSVKNIKKVGIPIDFKQLKSAGTNIDAITKSFIGLPKGIKPSEESIKAYNNLLKSGIPLQQASLALTDTETAANVLNASSKDGVIAAEELDSIVTGINNKQQQQSLLTKLAQIAVNTPLIGGLIGETGARIGNAIAAKLEQKGIQGVNKALITNLAIVGMALIAFALLALAIYGLIKLFQAIKNSTPEAKMKAAAEEANKMAEAADKATESYNNLKTALDSLDEKYDSLNNLVTGTKEWKNAVNEINQEVLDLIEKYPELLDVVSRDSNGILKFTDQSALEKVLNGYDRQSVLLRNMEYQANINSQETIEEQKARSVIHRIGWKDDLDSLMDFSSKIANGELLDESEIKAYLKENNINWTYGEYADKQLKEFGKQVNESNKSISLYTDALISNTKNLIDTDQMNTEQQAIISNVITSDLVNKYLEDNKNNITFANIKEEYAKMVYGDSAKVLHGRKIQYQDENGQWQTTKLDREMTKTEWASKIASEQLVSQTEKVVKNMNYMSTEIQHLISGSEGNGLTSKDLSTLANQNIKDIWANLDDSIKELYKWDEKAFEEYFNASVEYATNAYEKGYRYFTRLDTKNTNNEFDTFSTIFNNLTSGALNGLAEHLQQVESINGLNASQNIAQTISNLLENQNEENQNLIVNTINGLDWNDTNSFNGLLNTFKQLQITIDPNSLEQLRRYVSNFAQYAITTGQGIYNNRQLSSEEKTIELDNKLSEQEGLDYVVEQSTKQLVQENSELSKNTNLLKANAIDANNSAKKIDKLNEVIKDNTDILKSDNSNLPAYGVALKKIAQQASEIFNTDITTDFVEEYKEQFLALAEGGEEAEIAFINLSKIIGTNYLNSLKLTEEEMKTIQTLINNENAWTLEIGETHDFSTLINDLIAVGMSAEEAAQLIEKMYGVEVTWETQYVGPGGVITDAAGAALIRHYGGVVEQIKTIAIGTKKGPLTPSTPTTKDNGNQVENTYDWLYNKIQDINQLLREREKIEKRYQNLINENKETLKESLKTYTQSIVAENEEYAKQEEMYKLRQEEMKRLEAKNTKYRDYAWYDWQKQEIQINWQKIDSIKNSDLYEAVSDFISSMEDIEGKIDEADDRLLDIKQEIADIRQEYVDAYIDYEERVAEALEQIDQDEVDELENVYNAINDARTDLLDAVRDNVEATRQLRDNNKTEDEIAKKERRLAYLRQDTTGGNILEIKQLEQELSDLKDDYRDTLIDQALDNLQDQADNAADQRERMIEAMNSQIEWNRENAVYANKACELIQNAPEDIESFVRSELYDILYKGENWGAYSAIALQDMIEEACANAIKANTGYASAMVDDELENTLQAGVENGGIMQDMINYYNAIRSQGRDLTKEEITLLERRNEDRNDKIETAKKNNPDSVEAKATKYTNINTLLEELERRYQQSNQTTTSNNSTVKNKDYSGLSSATIGNQGTAQVKYYSGLSEIQKALQENGYSVGPDGANGYYGPNTQAAIKAFQTYAISKGQDLGSYGANGVWGPLTKKAFDAIYEHGGLADFTGPAWLDGSKSKPELVLNATDTENFIQLKDVLRDLLRNGSISNQSNGEYAFDIDINVDELGSDYDVEQLANKVKDEIVSSMNYRNVNAINFIR